MRCASRSERPSGIFRARTNLVYQSTPVQLLATSLWSRLPVFIRYLVPTLYGTSMLNSPLYSLLIANLTSVFKDSGRSEEEEEGNSSQRTEIKRSSRLDTCSSNSPFPRHAAVSQVNLVVHPYPMNLVRLILYYPALTPRGPRNIVPVTVQPRGCKNGVCKTSANCEGICTP